MYENKNRMLGPSAAERSEVDHRNKSYLGRRATELYMLYLSSRSRLYSSIAIQLKTNRNKEIIFKAFPDQCSLN